MKGTVNGGATITYIGDYFEWSGTTNDMKKYYYAGSTRVAMRTGASTLNYLLGDHLGSMSVATDSNGVKSAEQLYTAWGTARYASTPGLTTSFRFTGQRRENYLDLYWYGSRWYDPTAARFIQADSIVPSHNQGTEDSRRIQLLLVVDYHEPYLLAQLGELYRADLQNDPKNSDQAPKTNQLNLNPTDNKREQNNHEDTESSNDAFQPLIDFNGNNNLWNQQKNADKNNKNNLVDMMPARMNSMGFDRYAYTSNCPTKYIDPSGHCDIGHIILGSGFIIVGGIIYTIGFVSTAGAISSLNWHLAPLTALGAVSGGLIFFGGIVVFIKDECIPNFIGIK